VVFVLNQDLRPTRNAWVLFCIHHGDTEFTEIYEICHPERRAPRRPESRDLGLGGTAALGCAVSCFLRPASCILSSCTMNIRS